MRSNVSAKYRMKRYKKRKQLPYGQQVLMKMMQLVVTEREEAGAEPTKKKRKKLLPSRRRRSSGWIIVCRSAEITDPLPAAVQRT